MTKDQERLELLKGRLADIDALAVEGIQNPELAPVKLCQIVTRIIGTITIFIEDFENEAD